MQQGEGSGALSAHSEALGQRWLELGVCLRWHSALQGEQLSSRSLRRCLETALAWSRDLAVARGWPGLLVAAASVSADTRPAREKPP